MKKLAIFLVAAVLLNACGDQKQPEQKPGLKRFGLSAAPEMITYDTIIKFAYNAWANLPYRVRITRPKYDTSLNEGIFMTPGKGEMDTTAKLNNCGKFGPHYWLANGWKGDVLLGNGTHYPTLFTIIQHGSNDFSMPGYYYVVNYLIKTYHIKPNAAYGTGLSMGSWAVTSIMSYELNKGDEAGMKLFKATAPLSGAASITGDYKMIGHWAKKYGGKGFFAVGYLDGANDMNPPLAAKAMNDSAAGSAYYAHYTFASGGHGGWNDEYNPANNQFWTGSYIVNKVSPGTYKDGSNLFQWLLRQGDTSLSTSSSIIIPPLNVPPVAVLAPVSPITLPINWVTLDGTGSYDKDGTVDSVAFSQVSGPNTAKLIYNTCKPEGAAVGLIAGTYVFKMQIWDNQGASAIQLVTVIVNPAPVTTVASIPLSYTVFGVTTSKTIVVKSDGSYIIQ